MTWNINFTVEGGAVDPATVKVVGTPPDGPVSVGGYETETSRGLNVNAAGANASAYISKPVPPKE